MFSRDEAFERRLKKALDILRRANIRENNSSPPLYKMFWKLGIRLAPPHFLAFWVNALVTGLPAGIAVFGLFMSAQGKSALTSIDAYIATVIVTAIWGSLIAAYYKTSKAKHRLPDWDSIN